MTPQQISDTTAQRGNKVKLGISSFIANVCKLKITLCLLHVQHGQKASFSTCSGDLGIRLDDMLLYLYLYVSMYGNLMAHYNIVYGSLDAQGVNQLWMYEARLIQGL